MFAVFYLMPVLEEIGSFLYIVLESVSILESLEAPLC